MILFTRLPQQKRRTLFLLSAVGRSLLLLVVLFWIALLGGAIALQAFLDRRFRSVSDQGCGRGREDGRCLRGGGCGGWRGGAPRGCLGVHRQTCLVAGAIRVHGAGCTYQFEEGLKFGRWRLSFTTRHLDFVVD